MNILNQNQCLSIILENIKNKIPSSFIRKGDGENIFLGYKLVEGVSFLKYRKKLVHFNIPIWDISFQKFLRRELQSACRDASILGISPIEHRHGFWSLDNDLLSKLSISKPLFGDVNFHMGFIKTPKNNSLLNPVAEEVISNKNIGIIGHYNVSDFLSNYSSKVITKLKIPKRRARFQRMNQSKYDDILKQISFNNSLVDIWIVAAGIYAKPFCEYIKNLGNIGIDIGSSLDTWDNEYHSRGHLRRLYNENN